jgi:hypothetical protein
MEPVMTAFLTSPRRIASVAFALGLGAAALATPALAMGRGPAMWPHSGPTAGNFRHGGSFQGRGSWGPEIGAGLVGGLIGGAIIGSAGYPYYDNGYGSNPCWQYQNVYSSAGAYLGQQMVNTCQ